MSSPPTIRLLAITPGDAPPSPRRSPERTEREERQRWDARLVSWTAGVALLGRAGVDAVQLREKHLDDRDLLALARRARALAPPPPAGPLLLVNGRADVAIASGADGVHLPSSGLPTAALAERFGRLLLGRSTHSVEEVEAARRDGAAYVTFGPVYPTPSKAAYGEPPGIAGLERAVRVGLPVVALGGVTLGRLPELAAAGAAGVAGIRLFRDAARLPELVERGRELFPGVPVPRRESREEDEER